MPSRAWVPPRRAARKYRLEEPDHDLDSTRRRPVTRLASGRRHLLAPANPRGIQSGLSDRARGRQASCAAAGVALKGPAPTALDPFSALAAAGPAMLRGFANHDERPAGHRNRTGAPVLAELRRGAIMENRRTKKSPANARLLQKWWRARDSNPGNAINVRRFSRPVHSTALPTLQVDTKCIGLPKHSFATSQVAGGILPERNTLSNTLTWQ